MFCTCSVLLELASLALMWLLTYLWRGRQLRQRIVHHVELIWVSYHVFYYIVIHDIRL